MECLMLKSEDKSSSVPALCVQGIIKDCFKIVMLFDLQHYDVMLLL
jgi:hypothetical protein